MMLFMILMAIGIVVSFVQIVYTGGMAGIFSALLMTAIDVYIFVCVYSLYDMFRNEKLPTNGQIHGFQNQQPVVYIQPQFANQPYQYNQQQFMHQPPVYAQQQQFSPPSYSQEPPNPVHPQTAEITPKSVV
jgi:hypothetical protein